MGSPFPYSKDNKRYHTWNYHLNQLFGGKVFKVSLNAGFTCPNIDGTKGYGGCTYCSNAGSGDFAGNPNDDLVRQFEQVKTALHQSGRRQSTSAISRRSPTPTPPSRYCGKSTRQSLRWTMWWD